jgi:energy-coupling factor transporter ATP-binding protein EcfA2
VTSIGFHDAPIASREQDHLGRDAIARALYTLIDGAPATDAALVVGVYGPWGAGKSSLMKLLQGHIQAAAKTRVAWFEAWRYARQDEELWRALLLALVEALRADIALRQAIEQDREHADFDNDLDLLVARLYRSVERTVGHHLSYNWRALLPAAARLGLHATGLGLFDGLISFGRAATEAAEKKSGEGEDAKALGELLQREAEKEYREQITALDQFQGELRRVVKKWLTDRGERLVVFIDDLDRCNPDAAVGALEAIKLFLDIPGVVFVLGLHRQAIEAGVAARYPALKDAGDVERYLDKIVQIPVTVPEPGEKRLGDFVKAWADAFAPTMPASCRRIILTGTDPNPRALRRVLSAWLLSSLMHAGQDSEDWLASLAKLAVLQTKAPKLFAAAERDVGYLQRIESFANGATVDGLDPIPEDSRLLLMLKDPSGRFQSLARADLEKLVKLTAVTG